MITEERVDIWSDLVLRIRQQADLLSRYFALTELSSLLQAVAIATLCSFSALMASRGTGNEAWGESKSRNDVAFRMLIFAIMHLLSPPTVLQSDSSPGRIQ